jgi:hypothetical protein
MSTPESEQVEELAGPSLDDAIREAEAVSLDRRRWVKSCVEVLGQCDRDLSHSPEAQAALDSLLITACARLKRLLRCDLKGG